MTRGADHAEPETPAGAGRVLVVCPRPLHAETRAGARADDPLRRKSEARHLAEALGLKVNAVIAPRPAAARAATLVSAGQCDSLKERLLADPAELVFIDAALSPRQQRNLEDVLGAKVLDRTGLILEVFAIRARSRAGRLQVSLARLAWQRTRLVRSWTHLERQRGATAKAAGPGERQLELDRRLLDRRLLHARRELAKLARTQTTQRARRRHGQHLQVVALVGYSNAGKSTLFNALTRGGSQASPRLFETLDPKMRRVSLDGAGDVVLSDTVGFISDLPHELIEAFRATLEEVRLADLILHVRDAASPYRREESLAVESVLDEILAADETTDETPPVLSVWNKIDLLETPPDSAGGNSTLAISARRGDGMDDLRAAITRLLRDTGAAREILLPHDAGDALAWLHRHGEVRSQKGDADGVRLQVHLADASAAKFAHLWPRLARQIH
ncbi:MAG: GTPase HflX [Alphaproteobacteria bacterium]|nr:GTPase HflX [Alphaproteobacteria bacterium]MDA7982543.1 GTPase HflX [Alphaproteobacteria bacterium]MDA7988606.1 GTPase HflX [Alphaproteobacteria bacterium]MDA8009357.1 GTPase HflX [Alphaproteobacteria bacterium]